MKAEQQSHFEDTQLELEIKNIYESLNLIDPDNFDQSIGGRWSSYDVSWTGTGSNPAIGNGTLAGLTMRYNNLVFWQVYMKAGSTTTFGTGSWIFSLPSTVRDNNFSFISTEGSALDDNTGNVYLIGQTRAAPTATSTRPVAMNTSGTYITATDVSSSVPFTWAQDDVLNLGGKYEITS